MQDGAAKYLPAAEKILLDQCNMTGIFMSFTEHAGCIDLPGINILRANGVIHIFFLLYFSIPSFLKYSSVIYLFAPAVKDVHFIFCNSETFRLKCIIKAISVWRESIWHI